MTMLDSEPLDENLLKLAPMDSDRVLAGTFNIAKLVATILRGRGAGRSERGADGR